MRPPDEMDDRRWQERWPWPWIMQNGYSLVMLAFAALVLVGLSAWLR